MQCTRQIYPRSKFNYVSCTKLVEKFTEMGTGPVTTNNNLTGNINCSCTKNSSSNNKFSSSCSCTRKTTEGFVDVMTNPSQQMGNAIAERLVDAIAELPIAELPIAELPGATNGEIVSSLTDLDQQPASDLTLESNQNTNTCNKTSLHITIGVLVTIIIGLVAYIVYNQMKNKQQ